MENSTSQSLALSTDNEINQPNLICHKLDNLPDLIYQAYLFKYLDLADVLKLRLVSKRLYSIVKDYNIIELAFPLIIHKDDWFSTAKKIKRRNQLNLSLLGLILNNPSNNVLNLKYLKIENLRSKFRISLLNKFTKLQVLALRGVAPNINNQLHLPDLKALRLEFYTYKEIGTSGSLIIDAPNLYSLLVKFPFFDKEVSVYDADNDSLNVFDNFITFTNPQSVKYLDIGFDDKNISVFSHLECLEASEECYLESDELNEFRNLKKLIINHSYMLDNVDFLRDLFSSKKDDLEMVLFGVKIKGINKLTEFENEPNRLKFQLDNYDELENNLSFVKALNYNNLIKLLPKNQPSDLFSKYTNILQLIIDGKIEDVDRLIGFIKKCSCLCELEIERSSLGQQFFDKLPSISLLYELTINREDTKLNFEFIMQMPYLRCLFTDQHLPISQDLNLNNFRYLRALTFFIQGRSILIFKKNKDRYTIEDEDDEQDVKDKEYNLNELIERLEQLNNLKNKKSKSKKRKRDN